MLMICDFEEPTFISSSVNSFLTSGIIWFRPREWCLERPREWCLQKIEDKLIGEWNIYKLTILKILQIQMQYMQISYLKNAKYIFEYIYMKIILNWQISYLMWLMTGTRVGAIIFSSSSSMACCTFLIWFFNMIFRIYF